MMWFAALALMSMPIEKRVTDVRSLFSVNDFPEYLVREGTFRIVYTRTTVGPDGSLQNCTVEATSGDAKLDEYTCALIVKRARFSAARWTDGSPAYGLIRVPVSWIATGAPLSDEEVLKAFLPSLELSVNQLPKGARSIAGVGLHIAADEKGRILACDQGPPVLSPRKKRFSELIPVACKQVMETLTVPVPRDGAGKPVRSIQNLSVHFKLERKRPR